MARIRTYGLDSNIDPSDKIIGTDGTPGPNQGDTKNFSVSALVSYIGNELGSGTANTIPMWTPDGNTLGDSIITTDTSLPVETDGIVVNGKFRIEVPAGTTAFNVSDEVVNRINTRFDAGIIDYNSSLGTSGQVLSSTGAAVSWIDAPVTGVVGSGTVGTLAMFTPDGVSIGDSIVAVTGGGTKITVTGGASITGNTGISGNLDVSLVATFEGDVSLGEGLKDASDSYGTANQILTSTGTQTSWQDFSALVPNNITGSGTVEYIPKFTPDGTAIGNSIMFTKANGIELQVGVSGATETILGAGSISTGDISATNINAGPTGTLTASGNVILGDATADTTTINSTLSILSVVKDSTDTVGTVGQVLAANAASELLWEDQTDTTYVYNSTQAGSDAVIRLTDGVTNQDVTLVAGNSISLTDDGSNNITIAATGGAANTEYDLNAGIDGSNGKIRLIGSDATTDIVTITPGNNIVITSPSSNELNIATSSDVVTGSGTLNTIPLWTPDGQTLGDSNITVDANNNVTITGLGGASTEELKVVGINSKIVIESSSAGNAHLEFRPNVTSSHAAVFELTDANATRHFLWKENGSEIMRLRGLDGSLGVGTTNPVYKVHVDGTNGFRADDAGNPYFQVLKVSGNTFIDTGVNGSTINIGAPMAWTQNLYVQGTGRFKDGIKDTNNLVGTSGQVLSSTGSDVEWIDNTSLVAGTDINITQVGNEYTINSTATLLDTTYTFDGASATPGEVYVLELNGSDASQETVTLQAGTNISFSGEDANGITINTLDNIATRDTNSQHSNAVVPAFDDATGTVLKNTGIRVQDGSLTLPDISSIGTISDDVLVNGTITADNLVFGDGGSSISDFEEGTWTPDIKTYLTNTLNVVLGLDFDVQEGKYIKINDKVFCEFKLRYKLLPTYSWPADEYLVLTGLPFTPEGGIRNSNLSGNINRLSSFNSTSADELPRLLSNAASPFYDVIIPTGMGLLPPQNTNSGTKPLLASLFSDQDNYTGGNYVEFYGSFTYTTA